MTTLTFHGRNGAQKLKFEECNGHFSSSGTKLSIERQLRNGNGYPAFRFFHGNSCFAEFAGKINLCMVNIFSVHYILVLDENIDSSHDPNMEDNDVFQMLWSG